MLRLLAIAIAATSVLVPRSVDAQPVDNFTGGIFDVTRTTIVKIHAFAPNQKIDAGTGVIISPDGYVLTALHVVGGQKEIQDRTIEITTFDSGGAPRVAKGSVTVVKAMPDMDIALLRMTGWDLPFADINTKKLTGLPRLVAIVSSPEEPIIRPISGELNVTDQVAQGDRLTMRIPVIPGNSGAPVFDASAKLVAIVTSQYNMQLGREFSLATPLWAVSSFLPMRPVREAAACRKEAHAKIEDRHPFKLEVAIECLMKNKDKRREEYTAPTGYMIEGLVKHDDESNDHGWVDMVEYGSPDRQGHITSLRITVECRKPDQKPDQAAWARTKLQGIVKKIWKEDDDREVDRQCKFF